MLPQKELIQYKGLWHSIKQENIDFILKNNKLEARTTQRWWENGIVHRDNHEFYEDSFFMKGWSMTRDKDMCINKSINNCKNNIVFH
jgi:hypothetical protein